MRPSCAASISQRRSCVVIRDVLSSNATRRPGFRCSPLRVFLDSLRFKFTDHPNTQEIFGRLDGWAGSLGLPGLFGHTGLFSQYVIGSAELLASTLLLVGLLPRFVRLNALGALIGFAVMTGAVSFHLFTPLGIDPNNDGGGLFAAA